jgi:SNF2 family DNA or RNA helicase
VNTHLVEMTEHETAVYEDMRRKVELKFKKNKSKKEREEAAQLKINFFSELTRLRLASCSMKLIHEGWAEPPSKVTALLDLLDLLMEEPSNHILVFSQFTSFLDSIKPELKNRCYDFLYLDGQTPLDKRQELVKSFQDGDCRLFLSSLKAGGLGINLTQANYVILLDPWWNPAIENQAMDRAHRLGQKRVVSVIRLISQHTIEEKILRLHETKQNLSDDILDGTADSYKLTYEDVMDMVAPF